MPRVLCPVRRKIMQIQRSGNYRKTAEKPKKQKKTVKKTKESVPKAEEKANELFDKKLAEEEVWIRQGIKARRTRNEGRVRALQAMRAERAQRRDERVVARRLAGSELAESDDHRDDDARDRHGRPQPGGPPGLRLA